MTDASRASDVSAAHGAGARVLIQVAMAEEAAPLAERLTDLHAVDLPFVGAVHAVRGRLLGLDVVVTTSGVGIAAASTAATWGVLATAPHLVISAGTAGGLGEDVGLGSVVVGTEYTYSIADATAFGYAPGQVPGGPERFTSPTDLVDLAVCSAQRTIDTERVHRGLMLSGDAFVTAAIAGPMRERFPGALSADMETTAIAQTCTQLGVPFLAVRAVSDLCGPRADQQFHLEVDIAAEVSARTVERLLEQYAQEVAHDDDGAGMGASAR